MKTLRPHQIEALEAMKTADEGIIHLPTGSGKTFIQASAIADNLESGRVFVVLTPRILLTNQLYLEVKSILHGLGKDAQYLIVHSGKADDDRDLEWTAELPFREVQSTTNTRVVFEEFGRAQAEEVPLVIFGTYDSAIRIVNAGIPVYMLLCDEAHYLVTEEFKWIKFEGLEEGSHQFEAKRKYYFTATLKETASVHGLGMNNSREFGEVLYARKPIELIHAGEILRPRMHVVNVEVSRDSIEGTTDEDVHSVVNSFVEHRSQCKIGAKMLVVTKGSRHLDEMATHPIMRRELASRPNLTLFDISSQHGPRINGQTVSRSEFLQRLQGLGDQDEAIIMHVRILAEGIDIPGITGVMIMNQLKLSSFLQTLGRATRLYPRDRTNLYAGTLSPNAVDYFVKPYAWIIIPASGVIGEDLRKNIETIVYSLRGYDFNATEDVFTKLNKGSVLPESMESVNEPDSVAGRLRAEIVGIFHSIEEKEEANRLEIDQFKEDVRLDKLTISELITEL